LEESPAGGWISSVLLLFVYYQGEAGLRKLDIDVAEVRKLVQLVEKHNLDELTVEEGDLSINVKGRGAVPTAHAPVQPILQAAPAEALSAATEHVELEEADAAPHCEEGICDIVAPVVGVFYRSPSPDAPPFVEVGDEIEIGTEVGLIEAMKVFSPIPSEVAGEVVAIPAENGKLVQEGEVLVRVRLAQEQG
jgi:acetyl-CoA carboxylase biotin carboxyl carrier protein